ncbi:hypothetical protein ACFY3U_25490 [Micromonospora sp. NPDC000089]|uniref:hypothetical protein n=1 Tax=unclassified Micromonospora TaxID=2617518 RepID=UPI00368ED38A
MRRPRLIATVLALTLVAGCGADRGPEPARWNAPDRTAATGEAAPATPRATAASPTAAAVPAGCPRPTATPRSSRALDPLSAGYLGRDDRDQANAVDIAPTCEIVVGGRFTGVRGAPTTTLGSGAGAVLRLDGDGRRLRGVTRLSGVVRDLEVRRDGGDIAVATDRDLLLLDPTGTAVRWRRPAAADRVAVGSAGTVAAVVDGTVRVYGRDGAPLTAIRPTGRSIADVAVDDRSGLVIVGGYRQASAGRCVPVQIPWLHAYDRRGVLRWRAYDHPADRLGDRCADSRVERVAVGRDGRLYLAGVTDGGNSVFARSAADLDRPAPNVVIDEFTESSNTGGAKQTYLARFDPASGRQLAGQLLLARLGGGKGNTITPYAVTADERGRIYAGGVSAYQIADRDRLTLNGRRLAPYAGGDAWVLVLSADLRRRTTWTVLTDGGAGEVRGLAAGAGVAVAAARVDRRPFHRHEPAQAGEGGGYLAAWPALP